MNINDLTIGQAREIARMFAAEMPQKFDNGMIGRYVICRCTQAGVIAGKLIAQSGSEAVLEDGRRLWYHKPADARLSWYEGVSLSGLSSDSRVGPAVSRHLTEVCDIVICTPTAERSIREAPNNEQR